MAIAEQFGSLSRYLSVDEADGVVVVRCTDEFALLELDLESKGELQRLFDAVAAAPEAGALVILGTPQSFGGAVMDRFWRRVLEQEGATDAIPTPHASTPATDFRRGEAGIRELATNVRACPMVVVMALQGEVVTPFMGASLMCDYRIAADTMVFRNRAFEFGMPPGGALACLLPAYVGFGKASELLLEGRDIAAAEALELGLVNRVVPAGRLEAAALEVAREAAAKPQQAVAAVKALLTQSLVGLSAHYDLETSLITRCMYGLAGRRHTP